MKSGEAIECTAIDTQRNEARDECIKVKLEGACVGCSVNQMTLKSGVEMTIKKYAPQIEQVINLS